MFRTILITLISIGLLAGLCLTAGCDSSAKSGALIGGLAGAGLGQAIGGNTEATLIGGAIGAGGGYIVGNEMDKSKAKKEAAQAASVDRVTVNVTNSNGSVTPVTLTRQGSEYIGPKGEHYSTLPAPEQLKPIYGF